MAPPFFVFGIIIFFEFILDLLGFQPLLVQLMLPRLRKTPGYFMLRS